MKVQCTLYTSRRIRKDKKLLSMIAGADFAWEKKWDWRPARLAQANDSGKFEASNKLRP